MTGYRRRWFAFSDIIWIRNDSPPGVPARQSSTFAAMGHLALPLLAFVLASGCAQKPSDAVDAGVDTLATGTIVVRNAISPPWPDSMRWKLKEELRLGGTGSIGAEFASIDGLAIDSVGMLYVLDRQARLLHVFDSAGRRLTALGGPGGGPEELADPIGLQLGVDGRLWVVDPGNARYSIIGVKEAQSSEGPVPVVSDTRRRKVGGYVVPWSGGRDRYGRLFDVGLVRADGQARPAVIQIDGHGEPRDTFLLPPAPDDASFTLVRKGMVTSARIPFAPVQLFALDPLGAIWTAESSQYRLVLRSFSGDSLRIVEQVHEPLMVTPADRREALEKLDWFIRQGGEPDESRIPSHKPPILELLTDPAGRLWVRVDLEKGDAGTRFHVFDVPGRFLGEVYTPLKLSLYPHPVVVGDVLLATIDDGTLQIPGVVKLRVERNP